MPGLRIETLPQAQTGTTHFDLGFSLEDGATGLSIHLEYNTDLFDDDTIARMRRHYQNLIEAIIANPAVRVGELSLLDEDERRRLAFEWNGPTRAPRRRRSLLEDLAQWAARKPDAVAVSDARGRALGCARLESASNILARRLQIRPGQMVGLLVERNVDLVTGMLAIWKRGGVHAPLDPDLPTQRLAVLVEDAQIDTLLTQQNLAGRIEVSQTVLLDAAPNPRDDASPLPHPDPDGIAYLIYTSGSTGKPKGVRVGHPNLVSMLGSAGDRFAVTDRDIMPCLAPLSFDISLLEIWLPLRAGGATRIIDRASVLDLNRLTAFLTGSTLFHATPALMREILDHSRHQKIAGPAPRRIFTGGDRVPAALVRDLRAGFPDTAVTVLYGPTEATVIVSEQTEPDGRHALIGTRLAHARLFVIDARAEPGPDRRGGRARDRRRGGRPELPRQTRGQRGPLCPRSVPRPERARNGRAALQDRRSRPASGRRRARVPRSKRRSGQDPRLPDRARRGRDRASAKNRGRAGRGNRPRNGREPSIDRLHRARLGATR